MYFFDKIKQIILWDTVYVSVKLNNKTFLKAKFVIDLLREPTKTSVNGTQWESFSISPMSHK